MKCKSWIQFSFFFFLIYSERITPTELPSVCQEGNTAFWNCCLLQGFLCGTAGMAVLAAAVIHPWELRSWFISGRGPWAEISPFSSKRWLADNIQLSLMCHRGPMLLVSTLLVYCSVHWDVHIYTHMHVSPRQSLIVAFFQKHITTNFRWENTFLLFFYK